jgi:hypothetical protein
VPQGSILSPTLYNLYINDALQTAGVYLASLLMTPVCMQQTAMRVLLSENSGVVSAQWRPGVSAGILK